MIKKVESSQSLPYEMTRAVTLGSVGCFLCLVLTLFCVNAGPQRPTSRTQSRGKERKRESRPQVSQLQAQFGPEVNGLEENQS